MPSTKKKVQDCHIHHVFNNQLNEISITYMMTVNFIIKQQQP